jgi:hypothetical protein
LSAPILGFQHPKTGLHSPIDSFHGFAPVAERLWGDRGKAIVQDHQVAPVPQIADGTTAQFHDFPVPGWSAPR